MLAQEIRKDGCDFEPDCTYRVMAVGCASLRPLVPLDHEHNAHCRTCTIGLISCTVLLKSGPEDQKMLCADQHLSGSSEKITYCLLATLYLLNVWSDITYSTKATTLHPRYLPETHTALSWGPVLPYYELKGAAYKQQQY
jgi:hypothetical protein